MINYELKNDTELGQAYYKKKVELWKGQDLLKPTLNDFLNMLTSDFSWNLN